MADLLLSPDDEAQVREVLLAWRAEGVAAPLLPIDVDIDGDGVVDSWGLDDADEVVLVPGRPLVDTVFRSDGDGFIEGV